METVLSPIGFGKLLAPWQIICCSIYSMFHTTRFRLAGWAATRTYEGKNPLRTRHFLCDSLRRSEYPIGGGLPRSLWHSMGCKEIGIHHRRRGEQDGELYCRESVFFAGGRSSASEKASGGRARAAEENIYRPGASPGFTSKSPLGGS